MSRPILKIELTRGDWIVEAVAIFVLIGTVVYLIMNYPDLPEKIATHYNINGKVNATGSKMMLWIPVGIAIFLYGLITVASRFPHRFNYLVPITEDNARHQYSLSLKMMRFLKLVLVLIFAYLTYITIAQSKGGHAGLGVWFLPATIISIFTILISYLIKSSKKQP
ncbi:MAG: DUF1648 domain-containing protein [Cyclobacteriaceae bacterium]|nr:DUF1648 domain-containing protein [Cyclobacteriaceae bacterium]